MAVQTQTFTQFVSNAVAQIQGRASQLVDLTIGSVLRASIEAVAGVALWLQGQALQAAALTRFATSNASDADSWGADFGFTRLPAQSATGPVTFARATPTSQALVPVGTVVQSADGSQQYAVITDTTQTAYNASLLAYVIPAGITSITATIQALNAGAQSNAAAGAINTLGSPIAGIDTVTNVNPLTNGANAESDPAFRARFVSYIASLAKATPTAVEEAVTSLQQGASCGAPVENQDTLGNPSPGMFYVVVNDGTGHPSSAFLANAYAAINAVRPVGTKFLVLAPTILAANVAMTLTTAAGYTHAVVVAAVQAAIAAYIATLPVGGTLAYTRLAQIAYDASPGVTNVSAVTLNAGTADLVATNLQLIQAGTLTVS